MKKTLTINTAAIERDRSQETFSPHAPRNGKSNIPNDVSFFGKAPSKQQQTATGISAQDNSGDKRERGYIPPCDICTKLS